jgi:multiple sugar transport system permease protein
MRRIKWTEHLEMLEKIQHHFDISGSIGSLRLQHAHFQEHKHFIEGRLMNSALKAKPIVGSRSQADAWLGLWLTLPIMLLMAALVFYPLVVTIWDSLHRVDPMRVGTPFIGLKHYQEMLTDSDVQVAWVNTIWYVLLAVTLETIGGLLVALLLASLKVGRTWVLAAVILPWALPPVVNAVVWSWVYNPSYGLLNGLLERLGLISSPQVWFNDRGTALVLIALVHVWRMLPLTAVIVLAALQGIPKELYEAASIDGASLWRSFRSITLPLLAGALAIALTQSTVFAFNLFDEAFVLNGSSLDTRPLLVQVYISAFQNLHFSYGMALSVVLMLVSLAVSVVYVRFVYREASHD